MFFHGLTKNSTFVNILFMSFIKLLNYSFERFLYGFSDEREDIVVSFFLL